MSQYPVNNTQYTNDLKNKFTSPNSNPNPNLNQNQNPSLNSILNSSSSTNSLLNSSSSTNSLLYPGLNPSLYPGLNPSLYPSLNPSLNPNLKTNIDMSEFIKDYVNKKINEKPDVKDFKWLEIEIKSLEDLIELSKNYGIKYSKDYEYQVDLELLSKMTEELESLNKMIGLTGVKNQIVDLILFYALKLDNKNYDLLHTVIEGEPGTGKTELAEKLAKIYLKMGILKKNIFKKVRRSDLIAGYLGQTAIKTEKVLEECKGGVLFIDEAYSLGNSEGKDGKDSFSKECMDMINQWLTENKSDFVCIIAGYKDDLNKSFFSYNCGLERRFPIRFSIDTYSDDELRKIFIKKIKEQEWDWDIDSTNLISIIKSNRKYFKFNGGDMEVLFAKCKIAHSKNLLKEKDKKKKVLTEKDIFEGIKIFLENSEIKKRSNNSLMSSIYI
jgi:SpoVK/Ycf46/Vps4 family AAA+-type ATPase